jgi:hypothetical protein
MNRSRWALVSSRAQAVWSGSAVFAAATIGPVSRSSARRQRPKSASSSSSTLLAVSSREAPMATNLGGS